MSEFTPQAPADDEIDLLELIRVLWDGKLQIIMVTAIAAITSVFVSLSMPNIYHAQALLAPANDEGGGLSRMAGQFGGLAALAGVSLPGGGADRTALALEVLKSRKFVREFTGKHKIAPQLLAADSWDANSRILLLDLTFTMKKPASGLMRMARQRPKIYMKLLRMRLWSKRMRRPALCGLDLSI